MSEYLRQIREDRKNGAEDPENFIVHVERR